MGAVANNFLKTRKVIEFQVLCPGTDHLCRRSISCNTNRQVTWSSLNTMVKTKKIKNVELSFFLKKTLNFYDNLHNFWTRPSSSKLKLLIWLGYITLKSTFPHKE